VKKNHFILIIILLCNTGLAIAQEFNARVSLNKSQIQNVSLDYLDDLVPLIEGYLNNHNWTEQRYEENERIKMNIQIILSTESNNNFDASLVITVERPIYNTLQQTPLIVISDNALRFNFNRNRSLIHDTYQFDDIASILDYYAYIVLGYDADSFSELGGTDFFRQAQSILDIASSTGATGWTSGTGSRRNRYYLINSLVSSQLESYRRAIYRYHRLGLDTFTMNPRTSRQNIMQSLRLIQESLRQTTDDYLFDLFFSTKSRELTSVFIDGEATERLDAYMLLSELDSSRLTEYERLQ
jgi:hypothetical protein